MWNSWCEWNWERRRRDPLNACEGQTGQGEERGAPTHPDVALSWEEPLRDASGVQTGSGDVERGHEQQPAHLPHGGGSDQTLADDKVKGGNHAAQSQADKHT